MTKLSFKAADFASSVVLLKNGSCLEVRRDTLTGKAIPDRRTWASEAEWRASFPPVPSAQPKLEVVEIKEETLEIPAVVVAAPTTTAAEFTDTVQRLVNDLSKAPAACNALSDLLLAAPESLRDHIRRNHYFLTLLRAGMHQHAGLPSAEAVLTDYTPLF